MTLLKDLLHIPERVHKGDFVLRLTEGVLDPEGTLADYVVTPALARNFEQALGLIRSAVEGGTSKAAYLHGSFGSGKSHFMAVLYLLLRGEPAARRVPELAPVVAASSDWLQGRKFLLVPYHLIGARTLEAEILGKYVEHVRALHPRAPLPPVYLSDPVLEQAAGLRERLGDDTFFAGLAKKSGGEGGWGALEAGWDAAGFERAMAAPADDPDRRRLVADLVDAYMTALPELARQTAEGFVSLDRGLVEVSRHARELGYDALILFLDELILWLASHAGDLAFLQREGQKLAKLVEAGEAGRALPIVSFVARQRDLRELVGEHVPGAERLGFADVLKWWEDRFDKITLESRNLPAIVEKRLLRPKSEEARSELDEAFRRTVQTRPETLEVLQGPEADRQAFRRVYPFSPALIDTLVAVSAVLQRERTALKLLLQLLVDQRQELELGDLVPVGDLYDVLESGDEPFSEEMGRHFDTGRRLYRGKLRPLLEERHGLAPGAQPPAGAAGDAFRTDDRLVKTLLLAALTPEAPPLKALTPLRLAALNHGTITTPLPGQEASLVLSKCRTWAQSVGELRVGEGSDPVIALQLTGVDVDGVLAKAQSEDNHSNRRRKVKELLYQALGLAARDELFTEHEILWRSTRRRVEVLFGNVSDLPDESLLASGERWKLVLDFPFDPENRSPRDDLERLQKLAPTSRTVCWLPSFFHRDTAEKLGRLVLIDHVLAGERFDSYASHLSAVDRAAARSLLENLQSQLRSGLLHALEVAYGVSSAGRSGEIDDAHSLDEGEHLQSLDPAFRPRSPAAAGLGEALDRLVRQMLEHQYPAHPRFLLDRELRDRDLERIFTHVEAATQVRDGRTRVEDGHDRDLLRAVAEPLLLGEMHEAHFLLKNHWVHHFRQELGEISQEVSVGSLRPLFDRPEPRGLPREVQDLVIRIWALATNRGLFLHGGPVSWPPGRELPEELVLRVEPLPEEEDWTAALALAQRLFGLAPRSQVRTAGNVGDLAVAVRQRAAESCEAADRLAGQLEAALRRAGADPKASRRLATARWAARMSAELAATGEPKAVVESLAQRELPGEAETVARSLRTAGDVAAALAGADWKLFESTWSLSDGRREGAAANRRRVQQILIEDELALALAPALGDARNDAIQLLAQSAPPAPEAVPAVPEPAPAAPAGWKIVRRDHGTDLDARAARRLLADIQQLLDGGEGRRLDLDWKVKEPEGS